MSTVLKPIVGLTDNIQGNPAAAITLVEYGDYQCPHCGHAYPIVKQIQENFGEELKFVFRNFPLKNIHPMAVPAAIASEAAGKQDKFWEMHDVIFENQDNLHGNSFRHFAQDLGLDMDRFERDSKDAGIFEKVDSDFESGILSGVNGTPTFFINGIRHNGPYETEDLLTAINGVMQRD